VMDNEKKHRIFIIEDHRLVLDGLSAMLSSDPDFEVVGGASDGIEAMRAVEKIRPDLVVLDLKLPRMGGISFLRSIRKQGLEVKVLVLTLYDDEEFIMEVLRLGGNGYCLKGDSREEFFVAVRNVLGGKPYISSSILHNVLDVYIRAGEKSSEGYLKQLRPREQEVLKLIGEGYSTKKIAEYLYISRRTVETHRYNIMKKLNLHKTSALVRFAIENSLVTK
jgi:DNA-binding NarL/FixJ family response regulator